jgi:hypothetical protein
MNAQLPVQHSEPWRRLGAPASVSIALMAWTLAVSPYSAYGDNWAVVPAVLALPAALLWHLVLVALSRGRRWAAASATVAHLLLLVPLWVWCLMVISKDGL